MLFGAAKRQQEKKEPDSQNKAPALTFLVFGHWLKSDTKVTMYPSSLALEDETSSVINDNVHNLVLL